VGLFVVAALTAGLFGGRLPIELPGGVGATPRPTPNPVIVVPKGTDVRGTVLFVKAGNIWAATGTDVKQLSKTGNDSSPSWSADGKSIYLIETRTKPALFPYQGTPANYTLHYPVIVRMNPDGTGRKDIASSLYKSGVGGRYTYHVWYLQPAPDPKGSRIAIVSDGPNPIGRDPVIQFMPAAGGKLTSLGLPFTPQLGLADPTWRPDGAVIAYTRYERSGFEPAHRIALYTVKTKAAKNLTGPGFSQPSWSPDGRYLAAVRWSATGRDVVIIDAKTGAQVIAVTKDGHSWAPAWSPAGDAIVFMTASGEDLDLDMTLIRRSGTTFSLGDRLPITEVSQLDGTSRPSWYVPPDQLPTPAPSANPSPSAPSPSSSASSAPASPTP
jgi:Tol biopolymer transport system component